MARIVVTTAGSGGDIFPFVPVVDALAERGHDVVLAAPPALANMVGDDRREVRAVGPFHARAAVRRLGAFDHRLRGYRGFERLWQLLIEGLDATSRDLRPLVRGADLVVNHVFNPAGVIAAQAEGVPFVTLNLYPFFQPTSYDPPPGLPRLTKLGNRAAWQAVRQVWRRRIDPAINRVRGANGLPPLSDAALLGGLSPVLRLDLTDEWYSPPPPDRLAPSSSVGYPYWDAPPKLTPAARERRDLVSRYGNAVVFTLGTALAMEPGPFYEVVLRTIERLPHGAIVLGARDLDVPAPLRHRVLVRPYLPLSEVLPEAAAIVHHAGGGTTSAAMRFGCPSVAVPRCFDQRYQAGRVEELGLGAVLPWVRLSPDRLGEQIHAVLSEPSYRRSAVEASARIAASPAPAERAADAIDTLVAAP